jgi:hypothetical protein
VWCYVGTGLHKVPLASLQEAFFNCLSKNQIKVLEVIVVMESMDDGTGKESFTKIISPKLICKSAFVMNKPSWQ